MRQGDGADLLGSYDARSESIGVIYVDSSDDRQRVLTSILTQDKLGRKQVVLVLPEHNKAFQRPTDFDGLKNMRRGLKSEIVLVAPGSAAEFARQRRFPTYSSLESFAQSLRAEALVNGTHNRGIFGFIRKPKQTDDNAMPAGSSSHIEDEQAMPLSVNPPMAASQQAPVHPTPDPGENGDVTDESSEPNAAALGIAALSPSAPRPRITDKFPVFPSEASPVAAIAAGLAMQSSGSNSAPPGGQGDSGNMAAAGSGVTTTSRTSAGGGSNLPPGGSSPGGPGGGGGGVGGSRGRTRLLLAILLIVLTVLLIAGIAIAAVPGGLNSIVKVFPGAATTATVTITPTSQNLANTYIITGVTGHPDPAKRQVQARILTYTSPTQMKTANATGSIAGRQATGSLIFTSSSKSNQTFSSVTLRGTSGVPISFNGPVTVFAVPGFTTVTGFAVNVGASGNIGKADIFQSCCAPGITVRNDVFSGGRNAIPNTVIQQSDINGAADAIVSALIPQAQAALQKQVEPGEQVVPKTFQCNKSIFSADHKAGDIAKTVTVTVAITCKEEVYDQQAALAMAENLLKAKASDPLGPVGPDYKLNSPESFACPPPTKTPTGKIMSTVTQATADAKGNVTLLVSAEGVWVYDFCAKMQDIKMNIANKSKKDAEGYLLCLPGYQTCLRDLKGRPVVSEVQINVSTLPENTKDITIVVKPLPGPTETPTPSKNPTPTATPKVTPTPGLGGS